LGATVRPELASRSLITSPSTSAGEAALVAPATNDPAASALALNPADPARDVASRLEAYAASQGQRSSDQPPPDPTADPPTQQPPQGEPLTLDAALRQAQLTSREYLSAQEDYLLAAIDLLIQRHLWGPRFFASTGAELTRTATDGQVAAPLALINDLRATQRLPSGGELEARFLWSATQQLRDAATDRYTQASELVLSGRVPLLRGAGAIAREDLVQAERDLVYAARDFEARRRELLVSLTRDYLSLQQQQRSIANQQRALELLRRLERRTGALVEAGRLAEFQRNIAASDVLRAQARLANQREQFILALDRFKVRLGLSVNAPLVITDEAPQLPEPSVEPAQAATTALQYRLDLQTQADRTADAQRAVANAADGLLPDAQLTGSARLRTQPSAREGGAVFETDDAIYTAGVRVDWPLDRHNERALVRRAQILAERARRALDALTDTVVLESRAAVREIDRARFNLELQERAVQINLRRAKEQEIKADEVTAQQIVDTANALRDAENARDQARTDLTNAVLDYLLTTSQLRVTDAGTLALPGAAPVQTP
jgi:outer membrane protein TolC